MQTKIVKLHPARRKPRETEATLSAVLAELSAMRAALDDIRRVSPPLQWWEQSDER